MPTQPLLGKSALVTGGAHRIGRSIALALATAGANVAITWRTSQADAAQTSSEIESLGRNALAIPCDVRSESSVRSAIEAATVRFGRLDILVNNAAVFESAALDHLTLDQWDAVFETNTRGPFLVAREALPHLRAVQGRIINLGSLGGLRPWASHAHYCASKAALHMLTQAMAKAFAPEVSVNCVAPGWIEFGRLEPGRHEFGRLVPGQLESGPLESEPNETGPPNPADARRFAARTPMQRNGVAEDVAQSVLFFAAGPSFITGQILAVDGGLSLS